MGELWGQQNTVDKFYSEIRAIIPTFDFAFCEEVEYLDLRKASQFEISIRCGLKYREGILIAIEFSKAWKIDIQLAGGMIQVVSLFINYPPGFEGPGNGISFMMNIRPWAGALRKCDWLK